MNSLIEKLRSDGADCSQLDCEEAADELERKDAEIARLREALQRIAKREVPDATAHGQVLVAREALADTESSGGSERRSLLPPRNWTESSDER